MFIGKNQIIECILPNRHLKQKKKRKERTKGAYNQKQVTNVKRCPTRKIFPKRSNNATENKGLEAKAQKVSIYNEGEGDIFKFTVYLISKFAIYSIST